ncbi:hypothetical protein GCM10022247_35640 [Allokutzneria multivorans]|uniref:HTH cro/C1-type domain-containing protein n=1 Tax=Allokutzneria multivorans TaxID=1142134 RepID=A0ABP7SDN5_9PSEU
MTALAFQNLRLATAHNLTSYYAYADSPFRTTGADGRDPFAAALTAAGWFTVTEGHASLIPTPVPVPQTESPCLVHRAREDDPFGYLLREAHEALADAEAAKRRRIAPPIHHEHGDSTRAQAPPGNRDGPQKEGAPRKHGRPELPILDSTTPAGRMARQLRELRDSVGKPTYLMMEQRASFSLSALSCAARGRRMPTRRAVIAYATACGADPEEWGRKWDEINKHTDSSRP